MKRIFVSDYTLRKLAQDRAVSLLFREKTALANCIDSLGVNAVELAPIKNVKEDTIINRTIAGVVKNSALCIPVGFTAESLEEAWESIKSASKPCLQVMLPVSTVQMEYMYHYKDTKMLGKIEELCKVAREKCDCVEFVAMDATRADTEFVVNACYTAMKNGATAVTICDDAGVSFPGEFAEILKAVKEKCDIPIYVQVSDTISMSVACAVEAINSGADGVKIAMCGNDTLLADKFADIINARGESIGISCDLLTTEIHRDIAVMMKKINTEHEPQNSDSENTADSICLDADSTLSQVCEAVKILGYDLSDEDNGRVYEAIRHVCTKKNSIGAKELEALIASYAMQAPSTYHLDTYMANSNHNTTAMANVILIKDGEKISGVSTGDGPIDAAFRAIEQSIGYHYELDDFQIQSVTEGKEALGAALVRLRSNGKLYSGNGLSTDIVGASIRAYINALNKIVFEEN
ncbi:MAG: hypothetical protein IKA56_01495 [Clostridia bacterium]|nr:hypothetical protein [Clostridia bacterium]